MITLNIGIIASVLAIFGSLSAGVAMLYRLCKRFDAMESKVAEMRGDVKALYEVQFTVIEELQELGCDGGLKKARDTLQQQLMNN